MKRCMHILKNNLILLIAGIVFGFVALLLVHLLPTELMREHLYWSFDMIEDEFTDEVLIEGNRATLTGNFTDCLMLHHSIYENEEHSILEQAMNMYRSETYNVEGDPEGWWPGQSLKDYLDNTPQPREVSYGRYWHGYLVVLKPLLFLTSFNTIRLINSALQLILTGMVIVKITEKNKRNLAKAFLVSIPFLFFVSTYSSLSLSICFYIMLITLLVQLQWEKQIYDKKRYPEFFFAVGMLTSYFDFFTYPLITLAYPLCVYFYLHHEEKKVNEVKQMLVLSLQWGIGYAGMWVGKWILSDLLTGSNTIKDALETVFVRSGSAENQNRITGFDDVISLNIQPYANWCFVLLAVLILLMFVWGMKQCGAKNTFKQIPGSVIFILIALYPFVWYFLMQNHCEQHWQYTCRIISVAVFAVTSGLMKSVDK